MNGTSWIVGLWLLPVTVFIVIPLFMLVIWGIVKLSGRILGLNRPMSSCDSKALHSGRAIE